MEISKREHGIEEINGEKCWTWRVWAVHPTKADTHIASGYALSPAEMKLSAERIEEIKKEREAQVMADLEWRYEQEK